MKRKLSKSKILSSRQCKKRLWLEINQPTLAQVSESPEKNLRIGNQVGEISQTIYDPLNAGAVIDPFKIGFNEAIALTQELLADDKPIFEAAFSTDFCFVLADVMLRNRHSEKWQMIEVKSSASVKDYHLEDTAIQNYVASEAGTSVERISLGHIDSRWEYPGNNDYKGLIKEIDLTNNARVLQPQVKTWFKDAQETISSQTEPEIAIGKQCDKPFPCPFLDYCARDEPKATFPYSWLPSIRKKVLKDYISINRIIEMADVPDKFLNEKQLRVKNATLTDNVFFDLHGSRKKLTQYNYPLYFLDFETVNLAIPKMARNSPFSANSISIQSTFSIELR